MQLRIEHSFLRSIASPVNDMFCSDKVYYALDTLSNCTQLMESIKQNSHNLLCACSVWLCAHPDGTLLLVSLYL
jgi:hypothetical protein